MTRFSPTLFAAVALVALLPRAAAASDLALSFELAPMGRDQPPDPAPAPAASSPAAPPTVGSVQPLPVPPHGAQAPTRSHPATMPAAVHPNGFGPVALSPDWLPPPAIPPAITALAQGDSPEPASGPAADRSPDREPDPIAPDPIALVFELDLGPTEEDPVATAAEPDAVEVAVSSTQVLLSLFAGDTDSLVARAVGSAEGTRTPEGKRTAAYNGHTDPGNRAWNLGTFSYQHGAASPEEADRLQLQRLQRQSQVLKRRAQAHNLTLTLDETLNGIDLANQSPLAAIGRVGYIERLAEARSQGLSGHEAIVWARTHSYINPDTNRWNAPGLGNTYPSIRRDQDRRARAVASALAAYRQEQPQFPSTWTLAPENAVSAAPAPASSPARPHDISPEPVDDIFQLWSDAPAPEVSLAPAPAPAPLALVPTTEEAAAPASRVLPPVRRAVKPPLDAGLGADLAGDQRPAGDPVAQAAVDRATKPLSVAGAKDWSARVPAEGAQ